MCAPIYHAPGLIPKKPKITGYRKPPENKPKTKIGFQDDCSCGKDDCKECKERFERIIGIQ